MAPWGGIFDFNFDGKTSWDEQALGLMIINECMKEDSDDDDSSFVSSGIFSSGADHSWRSLYDYDIETGIDPNDYETEDASYVSFPQLIYRKMAVRNLTKGVEAI